jgi:flagellar hook-length control protein FliK
MSSTNLDFLFQVTNADRSFALPRADEPRAPFGDHFSLATAKQSVVPSRPTAEEKRPVPGDERLAGTSNGANDSEDRPAALPADEMPEETVSSETLPAEDSPADVATPTDESQPASDLGDETSDQAENEDEHTEGEPALESETAAMQAAALKQAQLAAKAEVVVDVTIDADAAAAQKESVLATVVDPRGESAATDSAVAGEAAVDALGQQSKAEFGHHDAEHVDSATVPANAQKPRRQGPAKQQNHNGQESIGSKNGDSAIVREALVSDGIANLERATDQQAGGEKQQTHEDMKTLQQDRAESRPRAEATAIANRIVVAALNGAAAAANESGVHSDGDNRAARTVKTQATKSDVLAAATGRLHSQHSATKRAGRASGAEDVPQVDPARFVGRVAKAFQTAHERGGTLQLRLSPPELGALRLELTVKDGVMSASLETENATARRVLLDHLPALRERLAEQNIRVERFDVDVRRENGGQQPAPQNPHQERQPHPEPRRHPAAPTRSNDAVRPDGPLDQSLPNGTGINLVA